MSFAASYHGVCGAGCGVPIEPGDQVHYVDHKVMHEGCNGSAYRGAPDPKPCPRCWLIHPEGSECP